MSIRSRVFTALAIAASCAMAQHPMPPSEKPVALLSGLGAWRHPIVTSSPEAQKFFDQGLTLMYGFNRYEALRSFRKAAELDPGAPMPHWGIAMALGPYINMDMDPDIHMKESCDAVHAGMEIKSAVAKEREWIEAAGARCPDFADPALYIAAMSKVAAEQPDDPDAQTLYAEALLLPSRWRWYAGGKPAEGVAEAERVLEQVIRRYPDHPGANHLYIHAVESSPTPERAVPSAQRLMGIVPAAGHMVHMPGHIWLVLGDFDNTVAVNERAVEVDREYFAKTGVMSSYGSYYLHNLQFLLYTRAMQGRRADMNAVARQMSDDMKAMAASMPEMVDIMSVYIQMMQVRLGLWDDVLKVAEPKAFPTCPPLWHHARALAYAAKGDVSAARREQEEFEKTRKPVDPSIPWDTNKSGDVLEFAAAALKARLETSPASAIPLWKRAVELQDSLAYDEPPAWYYPLRESLGAALLLSGDAPAAEKVFREGLVRSPNNGRMLFGLLESLKAQKKADAIAWVQKEFDKAWKGADVALRVQDF